MYARALPPPEAEGSKQLSQGNPESRRQRPDVDQSGVALAALDAADVRVVHPRAMCEFLLGEPSRLAQLAHSPAKGRPQVVHGGEA